MNSLQFVEQLLGQLRNRIPPEAGCQHSITLTKDWSIELTIIGFIKRVFFLDSDVDGNLTVEEIVDQIVSELKELTRAQLKQLEKTTEN